MRTAACSTLALVAFAANSVLCRLALRDGAIDPATFSTVRLVAGAAMLLLVMPAAERRAFRGAVSWSSAAMLALYAVPFSFAYVGLTTGTGALILFGSVQVTMLSAAAGSGERLRMGEALGLLAAFGGLVYLVLPGVTAPPVGHAILMSIAGAAWGVYSLRGRGARNAQTQTTVNFVGAVPFVLAVSGATIGHAHATVRGVILAAISGAIASGLGYVAWYAALRRLTRVRAALLQLSVPVLAAMAGVALLAEPLSARLVSAAVLVLGGIAVAIVSRERR